MAAPRTKNVEAPHSAVEKANYYNSQRSRVKGLAESTGRQSAAFSGRSPYISYEQFRGATASGGRAPLTPVVGTTRVGLHTRGGTSLAELNSHFKYPMLSGGQRTPTIVNPVGRPIGSSMKTDGQHERGEMQEEKSGRTTRRRESSAARSRTKDPRKSDDKEMGKLSTRGTAADDAKSDKEERAGAKAVPNGPQNVLVINDEPSRKKTAPVSLKHRSQSKHTVRNGKDYPQEFAEAVATGEVDREQETTGGHGGNKRASSAAMTRPKVNNASGVPPSLLAFGKSGSVENLMGKDRTRRPMLMTDRSTPSQRPPMGTIHDLHGSRPPSRQRPPEEAIFLGDVDVRRANESDEDSEESIRESVLVSSDGSKLFWPRPPSRQRPPPEALFLSASDEANTKPNRRKQRMSSAGPRRERDASEIRRAIEGGSGSESEGSITLHSEYRVRLGDDTDKDGRRLPEFDDDPFPSPFDKEGRLRNEHFVNDIFGEDEFADHFSRLSFHGMEDRQPAEPANSGERAQRRDLKVSNDSLLDLSQSSETDGERQGGPVKVRKERGNEKYRTAESGMMTDSFQSINGSGQDELADYEALWSGGPLLLPEDVDESSRGADGGRDSPKTQRYGADGSPRGPSAMHQKSPSPEWLTRRRLREQQKEQSPRNKSPSRRSRKDKDSAEKQQHALIEALGRDVDDILTFPQRALERETVEFASPSDRPMTSVFGGGLSVGDQLPVAENVRPRSLFEKESRRQREGDRQGEKANTSVVYRKEPSDEEDGRSDVTGAYLRSSRQRRRGQT